ncbi:MAG: zinc-dependent metalloprotease, partial [Angustibacter sp.]
EQAFSALVGLELRPRRLREAAALWSALGEEAGLSARDAIWAHPDLLPTPTDLADPAAYLARRRTEQSATADVDAAIARLLAEESPDQP